MAVELDSFFIKFKNLWACGHEAKLAVNSRNGKLWMNLQVGLQSPQPHPDGLARHQGQGECNARQRRNIRRAAARAANVAEEVIKAERAEEDATAEVATAEEATAVEATVEEAVKVVDQSRRAGIAVKAAEKIKATVEKKAMDKKKCTIELAPVNLGTIESFRDNVEKYFSDKKDIIDNVIACAVNNAGRSVRLESAVKRQLWMNYFNQPEEKYGDLVGVKSVLHCCKDLVNCDRRLD